MPRYTGNDGVVLIGSSAIGNLRSWEINESGDEIDVPAMGDTARQRLAGKPDVGGSVTMWYDDSDTVQEALDQGDTISLDIRPRGTGTGLPEFTLSSARITSVNWRGQVDAGLEVEFSFVSDAVSSRTDQ